MIINVYPVTQELQNRGNKIDNTERKTNQQLELESSILVSL